MQILKWLRSRSLAAITIISFIATCVFFWDSYLRDKKPALSITQISSTDVLGPPSQVADLSFHLGGVPVDKTSTTLRLIRVEFRNTGYENIRVGDFHGQWGIRSSSGTFLPSVTFSSASNYLVSNLNPKADNREGIVLDPVHLDRGERFILEILLLHPREKAPELEAFGKISGVAELSYVIRPAEADQRSVFDEALTGNLPTQLIRLPVYSFTALTLFILSLASVVGVFGIIETTKQAARRRRGERAVASISPSSPIAHAVLLDAFIQGGVLGQIGLKNLLDNPVVLADQLNLQESEVASTWKEALDQEGGSTTIALRRLQEGFEPGKRPRSIYFRPLTEETRESLKQAALLKMEDGKLDRNPAFQQELEKFIIALAA